jgi:hypothetical protein
LYRYIPARAGVKVRNIAELALEVPNSVSDIPFVSYFVGIAHIIVRPGGTSVNGWLQLPERASLSFPRLRNKNNQSLNPGWSAVQIKISVGYALEKPERFERGGLFLRGEIYPL